MPGHGRKYFAIIASFLFLPAFFVGCLDVEDIDRRMLVNPIGIDAASRGKLGISFRMPVVRPSGGTHSPFASEKQGNNIYRLTDKNGIYPAIIDAQSRDEHSLFLGHCRAVIIGEFLAKKGLNGTIDFLERLPRLPPDAYVIIARPDAEHLLHVDWPEIELHDQNLRLFLSNTENPIPSLKRWELFGCIHESLHDPIIPLLEPSDMNTTVRQIGLAVFRRDRMVGMLNYEESILMGLIRNDGQFGKIVLPHSGISTSFQFIKSKSSIRTLYEGQRPVFAIRVKLSTYLTELGSGYKDPMDIKELRRLERNTEIYLQHKITELLIKLRNLRSDPVQLGNYFRIQQSRHFSMKNWPEQYRQAEFRVKVHFYIERMGVLR